MLRRWLTSRPVALPEAQCNPRAQPGCLTQGDCLRLLSFNIQVGNSTARYRHYLTRSWQHVLPHPERQLNLQRIARMLADFDLVALQEVDGGSLRSGYINQVEHLAQLADFPYWYQQLNRNMGHLAQHSNGLLSRVRPSLLEDHPLPGPPGRGAIVLRLGQGQDALLVVMMHLALGARTRTRQLAYIRELLQDYRHCILMGDMNTQAEDLLQRSPLRDLDLRAPSCRPPFRVGNRYAVWTISCSVPVCSCSAMPCWVNRFPIICRLPWISACRFPCLLSPLLRRLRGSGMDRSHE